jgi:hypothetical protein
MERLETEQSLRLYYQQQLEQNSQGEKQMQLLDHLNYFLECSTNWLVFGQFKPTSPRNF